MPSLLLLLNTPHFTIATANTAYLKVTGKIESDVVDNIGLSFKNYADCYITRHAYLEVATIETFRASVNTLPIKKDITNDKG